MSYYLTLLLAVISFLGEADAITSHISNTKTRSDFNFVKVKIKEREIGRCPKQTVRDSIYINYVDKSKDRLVILGFASKDVVGKRFILVPHCPNFKEVSQIKSLKKMRLKLGKPWLKNESYADWNFVSVEDGRVKFVYLTCWLLPDGNVKGLTWGEGWYSGEGSVKAPG